MKNSLIAAPLMLAFLGLSSPLSLVQTAAAPYHLLSTILIGGEGGGDFLATDPTGKRLYVTHGTQLEVIDPKTKIVIGTVPGTPAAYGIAVVHSANRGYVSCGRNYYCVMFDLKTLKNLGTIPTGPKPDAILYDEVSQRVFAFSNQVGQSTMLDARTGKVMGTAALGGDVEVLAIYDKSHIFANLEDKSQVIAFDAKSLAVLHRYSLAPGAEPVRFPVR